MSKEKEISHLQKKSDSQSLSKTRQVLWRFSRVNENIDEKRTTFSELFFDLAVVFIFSLLASRLMDSIGHSVIQVELKETSSHNNSIGLLFWLVNFAALWFTWYQFCNYTKYHWIDNIGNKLLTLFLIFTLILQGAGIHFNNTFLTNYSLIISFVLARMIFGIAQYVALKNSPTVKISKELMIKTKRQLKVTLFTFILFIIYIICLETNLLMDNSQVSAKNIDSFILHSWKKELFLSLIIFVHVLLRFFWKVLGAKLISDSSYKIVFHTKERHHLFIIIALGELIVVTLTSSALDDKISMADYETIIYMFATPFITIIIWYIYKTVFYKASPKHSKKNYYVYLSTHVLLVLGILIFLGSIKSHMKADAFLDFGNLDMDVKNSLINTSRTFYSLGVVIGILLITISISIYSLIIKFNQRKWGNVVKSLSTVLTFQSIIAISWFIVSLILFLMNIEVRFSTVMYTTISFETTFVILVIWRIQKMVLKQFETVEDFDKYSAKLDH